MREPEFWASRVGGRSPCRDPGSSVCGLSQEMLAPAGLGAHTAPRPNQFAPELTPGGDLICQVGGLDPSSSNILSIHTFKNIRYEPTM